MNTEKSEANSMRNDDEKIQNAIKKYLLKHPGFFAQHPELMAELEVVSHGGKLTDLTTHQLRTLQKTNRELKTQMSQLIKNAQQSESMMNRLFELMLEMSVVNKDEFLPEFVGFVVKHFPADYFKVLVSDGLLDLPENDHIDRYHTAQKQLFDDFKNKSEPLSGRLQKEKISSIFEFSDDIKSAIVLPLGSNAVYGLLAFASKDEEKFHPNSSSDLLQKLTQILVSYFSQIETRGENLPPS